MGGTQKRVLTRNIEMLKKSLALVYQPPSNAGHSQNHKIDTLKTFMGSAAREVGILRTSCSQRLQAES